MSTKRKRRLAIILAALAVIAIVILLCTMDWTSFGLPCSGSGLHKEIAKINAANERSISIRAATCWEVGRGIFFTAYKAGNVVIAEKFVRADDPNTQYDFKVAYADNQSLVGVFNSVKSLEHLFVVVDFKAGTYWPDGSPYIPKTDFYQRLQKENPDLP